MHGRNERECMGGVRENAWAERERERENGRQVHCIVARRSSLGGGRENGWEIAWMREKRGERMDERTHETE